MTSRVMLIAASFAAATSFATQAGAGADDYTFEPVKPELQKGDDTLAVRLVQKSTSKPVADAVIVRSRVDMGPDGMPTMESQLKPEPSSEPGVYSFGALAVEHRSEGPRRARNCRRQDHLHSDAVGRT